MSHSTPPHCVNCSETHASADRKCPVFLQEKPIPELRIKDVLYFLDALKKLQAHQLTAGIQSFATAVRRPRGLDAVTYTAALVNRGVASLAPRTTAPLSLRSPPKLKTPQPPPCLVWSYWHVHLPPWVSDSPTIAQSRRPQNCRSRSRSGTRTKLCDTTIVPTAASLLPIRPTADWSYSHTESQT
jgi:hypothetical protein